MNLLESIGSLKLTKGAIKKSSTVLLSEEKKHDFSDTNEFKIDYLIQIDENVIGYGFKYEHSISKWESIDFWKFPDDIRNKISYLSRAFPSAFCFFVEANQIIYMPYSINHDILIVEIIKDMNLFVDNIEKRNQEICNRIDEEKMCLERKVFYENQTHFNYEQLKTIKAIFDKIEELDKSGFRTGIDLYIYSRIEAKIVLYPSKNSPLEGLSRYYNINKTDEGIENFNEITYYLPENLSSKFIAELALHHNPKHKKRVSKEQFEDFLNKIITFDDLKHLY
jgi:hypothetical protein